MRKVLIITYYWPPSGGAGVQRWLKFAKYLRPFGWEPVIYTPSNPEMPAEDLSLTKDIPQGLEVIKRPIWEPYSAYRSFIGQKDRRIGAGFVSERKAPGLAQQVAVWLRGNLFIPDARMFYVRPSVRFLSDYLRSHPVDAVVSTGPPHSMHLIGLGIKKATGLPWLADFRDPWTNIDFYHDLHLTRWADRRHRMLERTVLTTADLVTTIGPNMTEELRDLGAKRVETVTNGFDPDDFPMMDVAQDKRFSLSHIGSFTPNRNRPVLWQALQELRAEHPGFRDYFLLRTVGAVDFSVREAIAAHGLSDCWEDIPTVPHAEVLRYQRASRALLTMINDAPNARGILPGKLFEYMASGRPILAIGPMDGDMADVLRQTGAGTVIAPERKEALKAELLRLWKLPFGEKALSPQVLAYSRQQLTGRMAALLGSITPAG